MKRIQDSVHGLIEFAGRESLVVEMMRVPEVQRARRIRHLGLAHLVFPGAEHSRFAHAIGVAHLGSRFASALKVVTRDLLAPGVQTDDRVSRDLVLAGLCHDLGHGPLSHAWERYVVKNFSFTNWARSLELPPRPWLHKDLKWHELVTQAFLLSPASDLHQYLEQVETGLPDRVAALLGNQYYLRYMARVLSSDVDIDRGDFILRDAIHTGVAYGRYDLDWLVSTITVGMHGSEPVIGFDKAKAPRVVEQFLVARRAMYDTVYFHKAVQSAESMVGRLLAVTQEKAKNGDLPAISGFETLQKAIRGDELTVGEVTELDDNVLWVFIDRLAAVGGDPIVKDIAQRLRVRQLFRPLPLEAAELEAFLSNPHRAAEIAERVIADYVPAEPRRYLLYNRASYTFFEKSSKEAMFIDAADSGRAATPLRTHQELFHHPPTEQVIRFLFVPREAVEPLTKAVRSELRGGNFEAEALTDEAEAQFEELLEPVPASRA